LELLGETRVTREGLARIAAEADEAAELLIGRLRAQFGPYWPVL
jgi:hypothetical protein